MVSVHLYGKLRRFAREMNPDGESVLLVAHRAGDTVRSIVERIGIPLRELGANLFVDGCYADLATPIEDRARLGLFPDDMQLLYKWYFRPKGTAPACEEADVPHPRSEARTPATQEEDRAG